MDTSSWGHHQVAADPRQRLLDYFGFYGVRGFGASGHLAEFVRGYCPFHDHKGSRTLWVSTQSGAWGCWSARCPQHNDNKGRGFEQFLELFGVDVLRAHDILASLQLDSSIAAPDEATGPQSREDLEAQGRVDLLYVLQCGVDWAVVEDVHCRISREGRFDFSQPLSAWIETAAQPGSVEHDYWYPLCWWFNRGMDADVLTDFEVGYDCEQGTLVFPIRSPTGELLGVARREAKDRSPYILSGSKYGTADPRYRRIQVPAGQTFYGWHLRSGPDVHVAEGQGDTLHLRASGVSCVGKVGSQMSDHQLAIVRSVEGSIYLWADHDVAGLKGTFKDVTRLIDRDVRVVLPPKTRDPGDLGHLEIRGALSGAITGFQFLTDYAQLYANLC